MLSGNAYYTLCRRLPTFFSSAKNRIRAAQVRAVLAVNAELVMLYWHIGSEIVHRLRAFAEAWPDAELVQQVAAPIPWFHNCTLLDKVKAPAEREWYVRQTIENDWGRTLPRQQPIHVVQHVPAPGLVQQIG
ncbi:MAG: DUF1016 family protein [Hymenobacter sp.]|nr:MAG: DUF1016 family protein [Hymenobacter sp.]